MVPTLTVATNEWQTAARRLHETSSRTCVDFTNGQAFRVALLALKHTKSADPGKIARELGAAGRSVSFKTITRGKRQGQTRTVRGDYLLAGNDTLAHRILTARRIMTGKFHMRGSSLSDKAKNLISARIAAVNFVRSGWIPVIQKLASVVRRKPPGTSTTRDGARQRGDPKGKAFPAVFNLKSIIVCTIQNSALNKKPIAPETKGNPLKVAQDGLGKALRIATLDMTTELEKRLGEDFRKA